MISASTPASAHSQTGQGYLPATLPSQARRPSLSELLTNPRQVQHRRDLCVGCAVQITGGPHKDHVTGVITGEVGLRFWWVVSTSTRWAKSDIPFMVEKVNVLPG